MITSVQSRKCSVMQIGDLVCYINRYYGIVTEVGNYWEYGEDIAGVAVYWIDSGFRSWEFASLLEVISEK